MHCPAVKTAAAVRSAGFGQRKGQIMLKDKIKGLKKKAEQAEQQSEELVEEVLDEVSGAGNPFEDIPRVPTQPIDDELRGKA